MWNNVKILQEQAKQQNIEFKELVKQARAKENEDPESPFYYWVMGPPWDPCKDKVNKNPKINNRKSNHKLGGMLLNIIEMYVYKCCHPLK